MIPFVAEPIHDAQGVLTAVEVLLRPPGRPALKYLTELQHGRPGFLDAHHDALLDCLHRHYGSALPGIHLNLGPNDLHYATRRLAGVLARHGLSPAAITLEVTDYCASPLAYRDLRSQGFHLALDDIGREDFRELLHDDVFDTVKTDLHLIHHPGRLRTLTAAHQGRRQRVIIEGVSHPSHLHLARSLRADATQGYHHYPATYFHTPGQRGRTQPRP